MTHETHQDHKLVSIILGNRAVALWKFLFEVLKDPRNSNLIRWVNKEQMIFKVVNSAALAYLWGMEKNHHDMTYDKMSRALRYYDDEIIQKIPNNKLVFKFGNRVIQEVSRVEQ